MWLAAPLNVAGVGVPVITVGLVPFMGTLLTTKDGQGVDSTGAAERVIIFGAAAEGQEVPQGAETVETGIEDWYTVRMGPLCYPDDVRRIRSYLPEHWRRQRREREPGLQ